MDHAASDRERFYGILVALEARVGLQMLDSAHGRMGWPDQGVYFFFEPGELRRDERRPRVVRIGTHAVTATSSATLWNRLRTHRGSARDGGGNHRGSVFRLHVGTALLARRPDLAAGATGWGHGTSAPAEVRAREEPVERAVSMHIRRMPFLWVAVPGAGGPDCWRAMIKQNAIGLLSSLGPAGASADGPSASWLGLRCAALEVRQSGLWNVDGTDRAHDPSFLDVLEELARTTPPLGEPALCASGL